jgi:hypothetical protein
MEHKGSRTGRCIGLLISLVLFLPLSSIAGGVSHEPLGNESFLAGILPPPGFYVREELSYYTSQKIKDDQGRTLSLAREGAKLDKLDVVVAATGLLYISPLKVLGGFLGGRVLIPVVGINEKLSLLTPAGPAQMGEHRRGIGDITFAPNLSFHSKNGLFHGYGGIDIFAPTGPWNRDHLVNIGTNVWSFVPVVAATVFLPWHPNLGLDIKMDYSFNTRNSDYLISPSVAAKIGNIALSGLKTHRTPGQEFHCDFGVEYALTERGAANQFRIGAMGYFYQQVTDDNTGVGSVKHDRGRVLGIGPGVWWSYKKWTVGARTVFETAARNRPEGINSFLSIYHAF